MKAGTEFLLAELKDLIRRDPPYSEKFVQRSFMAMRQCISVIEAANIKEDNLLADIARLERNMITGMPRKTERNRSIVHEFKHGSTTGELAKKYKISRQRVHAIVTYAKERGIY